MISISRPARQWLTVSSVYMPDSWLCWVEYMNIEAMLLISYCAKFGSAFQPLNVFSLCNWFYKLVYCFFCCFTLTGIILALKPCPPLQLLVRSIVTFIWSWQTYERYIWNLNKLKRWHVPVIRIERSEKLYSSNSLSKFVKGVLSCFLSITLYSLAHSLNTSPSNTHSLSITGFRFESVLRIHYQDRPDWSNKYALSVTDNESSVKNSMLKGLTALTLYRL